MHIIWAFVELISHKIQANFFQECKAKGVKWTPRPFLLILNSNLTHENKKIKKCERIGIEVYLFKKFS